MIFGGLIASTVLYLGFFLVNVLTKYETSDCYTAADKYHGVDNVMFITCTVNWALIIPILMQMLGEPSFGTSLALSGVSVALHASMQTFDCLMATMYTLALHAREIQEVKEKRGVELLGKPLNDLVVELSSVVVFCANLTPMLLYCILIAVVSKTYVWVPPGANMGFWANTSYIFFCLYFTARFIWYLSATSLPLVSTRVWRNNQQGWVSLDSLRKWSCGRLFLGFMPQLMAWTFTIGIFSCAALNFHSFHQPV